MSEVYSSGWIEHRARFQGRVSGFERRVRMGPKVPDRGIDLTKPTKGITGYEAAALKRKYSFEATIIAIKTWTPPVRPAPSKLAPGETIKPTIREIKAAICLFTGIHENDLISRRRSADVVKPRQIGMALSKILTPHSLPFIGKEFGWRDHTTVLHAVRKLKTVETFLWKELKPETPLHLWVSTAFDGWKICELK